MGCCLEVHTGAGLGCGRRAGLTGDPHGAWGVSSTCNAAPGWAVVGWRVRRPILTVHGVLPRSAYWRWGGLWSAGGSDGRSSRCMGCFLDVHTGAGLGCGRLAGLTADPHGAWGASSTCNAALGWAVVGWRV